MNIQGKEQSIKLVPDGCGGARFFSGVVERLGGEQWSAFSERPGDKRRDLVLWVARRCSGLTLAELGRKAGGMDYAAVTMAVRRFPEACQRDKSLARLADEVIKTAQM